MRPILIKLLVLGLLLSSHLVKAADYSGFYIFGDSLTDTGNVYTLTSQYFAIPPESRYYQGRFSNGPNAADRVWESIGQSIPIEPVLTLNARTLRIKGKQAINFAFGGSETGFNNSVLGQFNVPGLLGQVGLFRVLKTDRRVLTKSIALLWSGGNDYFNQYLASPPVTTDQVIDNINLAIKTLHASGVRHFIVPNLPDLGDVPVAYILAQIQENPNIPATLSTLTLEHNQKLAAALKKLNKLPQIKIYPVDIYTPIKAVITPERILPGPASGCLYQPEPSPDVCSVIAFEEGDGLIYWDETRLSKRMHQISDLINIQ